jgi:hypothetical protein
VSGTAASVVATAELLPACGLQAHPRPPDPLRVVAGDPVAAGTASLEVEGRPPGLHHPQRAVETGRGGRDRTVQPGNGTGHPLSLPGHDPRTLGTGIPLTAATAESPVPGDGHAGFGELINGPGVTPAPRPRPTQPDTPQDTRDPGVTSPLSFDIRQNRGHEGAACPQRVRLPLLASFVPVPFRLCSGAGTVGKDSRNGHRSEEK